MALMGSSLGLFGLIGLIVALTILGVWVGMFLTCRQAFLINIVAVLALIVAFSPAIQAARETGGALDCPHRLRILMISLHSYHDEFDKLPPAHIPDTNGNSMHSWRVLILPFVELKELHTSYNFNEPWNGPNNRNLAPHLPPLYRCPGPGWRHEVQPSYFLVTGPGSLFSGSETPSLSEVTGSHAKTIVTIEAPVQGKNWMEPKDVTIDEAIEILKSDELGSCEGCFIRNSIEDFFYDYVPGHHVGFADGTVGFIPSSAPQHEWKDLLIVDDKNEKRNKGQVDVRKWYGRPRRLVVGNCLRAGLFVAVVLLPFPWLLTRLPRNITRNENRLRN